MFSGISHNEINVYTGTKSTVSAYSIAQMNANEASVGAIEYNVDITQTAQELHNTLTTMETEKCYKNQGSILKSQQTDFCITYTTIISPVFKLKLSCMIIRLKMLFTNQ